MSLASYFPPFLLHFLSGIGSLYLLMYLFRKFPRIRPGYRVEFKSSSVLMTEHHDYSENLVYMKFSEYLGSYHDNRENGNQQKILIFAHHEVLETTKLLWELLQSPAKRDIILVYLLNKPAVSRFESYSALAYYKSLVEGISAELLNSLRLCVVDYRLFSSKHESQLALDHCFEFIFSEEKYIIRRCLVIDKEEIDRPKVYRLHFLLLLLNFLTFVVFSSPYVSMMNPETLKPLPSFNPELKKMAHLTNIPIKLGLVHGFLYFFEFFLDIDLFRRHIGQRFTTLWYQLLQPERLSQHLQMQIETVMQLTDALYSKNIREKKLLKGSIWIFIFAITFQNAVTSLGWHSLHEQSIGFFLVIMKLVLFDLSWNGSRSNVFIGESLASGIQWIGGMTTLGGGIFLNEYETLHPTTMATLLFIGGAITLLVFWRIRGGIVRFNEM